MAEFVTEMTVKLVQADPSASRKELAASIEDLGNAVMEALLEDSSLIDPFAETDLAASTTIVSAEVHAATGEDAESILLDALRRAMRAVSLPLKLPLDEGAVHAELIPA